MKINILDVHIDNLSKFEVLEKVREFLRGDGQNKIFTPNPEMLVLASKDKDFKDILSSADILVPDGFGLMLASRFLGKPMRERITGVELVEEITKIAREDGKSIFLLGGTEGVGKGTIDKLCSMFHVSSSMFHDLDGIKIDSQNTQTIIDKVNHTKSDILFVALGHGKQERFIHENLYKIPSVKLAVGVGGAFDFISGKAQRAPKILQKVGLEWLWRLILEPWRMPRIFNAVFIFPLKVLIWKTRSTANTDTKHH